VVALGRSFAALVNLVYLPVRFQFGLSSNWTTDLQGSTSSPGSRNPDGLGRCWSECRRRGYYPLTSSTFPSSGSSHGGAPWLFHLDNVVLHPANVLLVGPLGRSARPAAGGDPSPSRQCGDSTRYRWPRLPGDRAQEHALYVWPLARGAPRSHPWGTMARVLSLLLFRRRGCEQERGGGDLPAAIIVVELARGRPARLALVVEVLPYVMFRSQAGRLSRLASDGRRGPAARRSSRVAARALWSTSRSSCARRPPPRYPHWSTEKIGAASISRSRGRPDRRRRSPRCIGRLPRPILVGLALFDGERDSRSS